MSISTAPQTEISLLEAGLSFLGPQAELGFGRALHFVVEVSNYLTELYCYKMPSVIWNIHLTILCQKNQGVEMIWKAKRRQ